MQVQALVLRITITMTITGTDTTTFVLIQLYSWPSKKPQGPTATPSAFGGAVVGAAHYSVGAAFHEGYFNLHGPIGGR